MQANVQVFKHYRSKVVEVISDTIKDKLEAAYLRDANHLTAFPENLGWIYQDLIMVERDVVACSPQEWDIYAKRSTLRFRNFRARCDCTPDVACVAQGVQERHERARNTTRIARAPSFRWLRTALVDDYLKLIVKKLDEWSANSMETELNEFTLRAEPPELDADGQYGMQVGRA